MQDQYSRATVLGEQPYTWSVKKKSGSNMKFLVLLVVVCVLCLDIGQVQGDHMEDMEHMQDMENMQLCKEGCKGPKPKCPANPCKIVAVPRDKNVCLVTVTVIADVNASEDVDAFI
ncbi:hypothetical protein OS493_017565 [Desmophyllum pertusum]|uniref:Uncharacterized protein n=1 Tax=Desmophyllum pertusum TaxID=174260 RepID=A0A9W9ZNY4_9CNID|nr:hypothetical protein OS493_017565 [Desmophyllum pertusum]